MKRMRVTVNGRTYEVDVEVLQDDDASDLQQAIRPVTRTSDWSLSSPQPATLPKPRVSIGSQKTLTSPINGVVLEIPVKEGQEVQVNEILFVVEAMKMKTNISSPQAGSIKTIEVKVAEKVEAGQVLLTFA